MPTIEFDSIGPYEDEVIYRIVRRLHARLLMGRGQYGLFDPYDGRDWQEQAREELDDGAVYHAIDEIAKEKWKP